MESQPQNPDFRNNPKNFHPCLHSEARDLKFGGSLFLLPYFMYASSKGSSETALIHMLV